MPRNASLLIVAHAFPPSGGAGVRRVLKLAKYLALWGWDITVLAPKRGEVFVYPYDPSLQRYVPEGVRTAESFSPERWLAPSCIVSRKRGQTSKEGDGDALSAARIWKWIYRRASRAAAIPDSAVTWLPFAIWKGINVIRSQRIDVILATAPPFSTLLVGAALKRITGVPLVAEFRDAWTAEPARNQGMSRMRRKVERHQEAWAVAAADWVVAVTDGVTADLEQRYSRTHRLGRFITVPNGFDRDDFPRQTPPSSMSLGPKRFSIVYTGTLGGLRTPWFFLQSLSQLLIQKPFLRSRLSVVFVGHCGRFQDGLTLGDYVRHLNLENVVEIVGFVTREESLRYQREADILLLLVGLVPPNQSDCYGLSAKAFDYTLAGKPVLTIAEEGATANYVRASGIGEVVSHYDGAGIADAIERAMQGRLRYAPCDTVIDRYDYASLVRRLESVLLSCMRKRSQCI